MSRLTVNDAIEGLVRERVEEEAKVWRNRNEELEAQVQELTTTFKHNWNEMQNREKLIEERDSYIEQAQDKIRKQDELISQLRIEKSELEDRVNKEILAHQATETSYQEKLVDMGEELQGTRSRHEHQTRSLRKECEIKLQQLSEQLAKEQEDREQLRRHLTLEFDMDRDRIEQEAQSKIAEYKKAVEEAREHAQAARAEAHNTKKENEHFRRALDALELEKREQEERILQLQLEQRNLQESAASLRMDMKLLREQEKKLREEQRDKYKQVLAQKEQEILLLENRVGDLQREHDDTLSEMRSRLDELRKEKTEIQHQHSLKVSELQSKISNLDMKNRKLQSTVESLKTQRDHDIASLNNTLDELRQAHEHELSQLSHEVWTAKGLAEDLQLKNEKLTRHLEERKEVVFQQKKEIQQLRDRETQLRRKVQQAELSRDMELTDLDMLGEGRSGGSVAIIDGLRAEKEQLQADLRNHKEEIEELQKQVLELRIKSRNAVRQAVETSTAGIDLSREELLEHARQGAEKALQETEKSLRQQLEHMAATLESQEQDLQRSRNRCREIEQDEQRARQRCEKLEGRRQELEEKLDLKDRELYDARSLVEKFKRDLERELETNAQRCKELEQALEREKSRNSNLRAQVPKKRIPKVDEEDEEEEEVEEEEEESEELEDGTRKTGANRRSEGYRKGSQGGKSRGGSAPSAADAHWVGLVESYKERGTVLTEELHQKRQQCDSLQEELRDLRERFQAEARQHSLELQEARTQMDDKVKVHNQEIQMLRTQVDEITERLHEEQAKYARMFEEQSNQRKELEAQLLSNAESFEAERRKYVQSENSVRDQLIEAEESVRKLTQQNKIRQDELVAAQEELSLLSRQKRSSESEQIQELESELETLRGQKNSLLGKLHEEEESAMRQATQAKRLEQQIRLQEEETERVQRLLEKATEAKESSRAKVNELESLVSELRDQAQLSTQATMENHKLLSSLQEARQHIENLSGEVNRLQQVERSLIEEFSQLKRKLHSSEEDFQNAQNALQRCRSELDSLRSDKHQMLLEGGPSFRGSVGREFSESHRELSEWKRRVREQGSEIEDLQSELTECRRNLKKATQQSSEQQNEIHELKSELTSTRNSLQRLREEAKQSEDAVDSYRRMLQEQQEILMRQPRGPALPPTATSSQRPSSSRSGTSDSLPPPSPLPSWPSTPGVGLAWGPAAMAGPIPGPDGPPALAEDERARLHNRIRELESQNARIRDVIRQMREEMENLQGVAAQTDNMADQERGELLEQLRRLRIQNDLLEKRIQESVSIDSREEVKRLQGSNMELSITCQRSREEVVQLRSEMERLQTQLISARNNLGAAETRLEQKQRRLDFLESEMLTYSQAQGPSNGPSGIKLEEAIQPVEASSMPFLQELQRQVSLLKNELKNSSPPSSTSTAGDSRPVQSVSPFEATLSQPPSSIGNKLESVVLLQAVNLELETLRRQVADQSRYAERMEKDYVKYRTEARTLREKLRHAAKDLKEMMVEREKLLDISNQLKSDLNTLMSETLTHFEQAMRASQQQQQQQQQQQGGGGSTLSFSETIPSGPGRSSPWTNPLDSSQLAFLKTMDHKGRVLAETYESKIQNVESAMRDLMDQQRILHSELSRIQDEEVTALKPSSSKRSKGPSNISAGSSSRGGVRRDQQSRSATSSSAREHLRQELLGGGSASSQAPTNSRERLSQFKESLELAGSPAKMGSRQHAFGASERSTTSQMAVRKKLSDGSRPLSAVRNWNVQDDEEAVRLREEIARRLGRKR